MVRRVSRKNYRSKRVGPRGSKSLRKRVRSRRSKTFKKRSLRRRRSSRRRVSRKMRGGSSEFKSIAVPHGSAPQAQFPASSEQHRFQNTIEEFARGENVENFVDVVVKKLEAMDDGERENAVILRLTEIIRLLPNDGTNMPINLFDWCFNAIKSELENKSVENKFIKIFFLSNIDNNDEFQKLKSLLTCSDTMSAGMVCELTSDDLATRLAKH
jgi:hypothetical protein